MTSLFPGEVRAAQPDFDRDELPDAVRNDFGQLLDWFTPNIFVCWIVFGVNILVFLAMLFSGFKPDAATAPALLKWGADYGAATIGQGEWWRVVTATFVHLGWSHVALNMYVLWQIGPFMERLLGNVGFVIVYLVCGIAGSICSLAWNPYLVSAGASGAIFGLYGALIGFLILRRDSIPKQVLASILTSAVVFLVVNAVFGALKAGTDIAAHAGGLVAGLVCGLVVSNPINAGFRKRRIVRATAACVGCGLVLLVVARQLPRPIDVQGEIAKFGIVETKVMASYRAIFQVKNAKDNDAAHKVETEVMGPWVAERKSLGALHGLPNKQQRVIGILVQYMDARQRGWETLVQGLEKHDVALVRQAMLQQIKAQSDLKESSETLK